MDRREGMAGWKGGRDENVTGTQGRLVFVMRWFFQDKGTIERLGFKLSERALAMHPSEVWIHALARGCLVPPCRHEAAHPVTLIP